MNPNATITHIMPTFDDLLDSTLRARAATPPPGLEQRLMAHIRLAAPAVAGLFTTEARVNTTRSSRSLWTALVAHAAAFLVIFTLAAQHLRTPVPTKLTVTSLEAPPPPPPAPHTEKIGGGGGQAGLAPATQGHLPKLEAEQLVPPKAPPLLQPKLAVEPSVVVQDNLKMADNKMPDLGVPNSNLHGFSLGDGHGSGIGNGSGDGIGPGSGGNTGGGPMHIGGQVHAPSVLFQQEAEFSEEARKAKFSGDVQVYLWVDEHGNPSHVQVVRGVGMGLDERAVAAVRQYKFKPATKDGKPVKVDLYINVDFRIF